MTLLLLINPKCHVDPFYFERVKKLRVYAQIRRERKEISPVEEVQILATPSEEKGEILEKTAPISEYENKFSGFTGISLKIMDLEKRLAAMDKAANVYQDLLNQLEKLESDRIELANQSLLMRDEEEIAALLLLLN